MGLFDGKERHELEELLEQALKNNTFLTQDNTLLIKIIDKLIPSNKQQVRLVLTTNINQSNFIIMSLSLATNQSSTGTLGLIDSGTGAPVTATFANQSYVSSDVTLFTATQGSDPNTAVVAGVAVGTGTLTVQADATYTDSGTGLVTTQTLTASVSVSVTAVVTAEAVTLVLNFTTPAAKK